MIPTFDPRRCRWAEITRDFSPRNPEPTPTPKNLANPINLVKIPVQTFSIQLLSYSVI